MEKASSGTAPAAAAVVTPAMEARLRAATALPDELINITDPDAPEVLDWSGTVRKRLGRQTRESARLPAAHVLTAPDAEGRPPMQDEVTQGPVTCAAVTPLAELPDEVRRALDQSADDLRHGRVEDAAAFLERLDARVEAYFAAKQAHAVEVKG